MVFVRTEDRGFFNFIARGNKTLVYKLIFLRFLFTKVPTVFVKDLLLLTVKTQGDKCINIVI
jgi:hypothetical protein